ncbi:MAG TPA: hypothetical protein VLW53_05700, partial [Candidatus Eisenbacteria bacterium]|nr:hypothetical protein [Candidatus Eisenbacteria bacterium]
MTSHVGRLYTAAAGVLAFFVLWAAIAAHPWQARAKTDPRLTALAKRERQLRHDAVLVQQIVARRAAAARAAAQAAAARAAAARAAQAQAQMASAQAPAAAAPQVAPGVRIV